MAGAAAGAAAAGAAEAEGGGRGERVVSGRRGEGPTPTRRSTSPAQAPARVGAVGRRRATPSDRRPSARSPEAPPAPPRPSGAEETELYAYWRRSDAVVVTDPMCGGCHSYHV